MTRERRSILTLLLVGVIAAIGARTAVPRAPLPGDAAAARPEITAQERAAGLTFDASVHPADQQAIAAAVAAARPEARRLIEEVDGLVRIRVEASSGHALGVTSGGGGRRGYDISLDLGRAFTDYGQRGVGRLVLHELGHVVDHALLRPELARTLDAGIPAGVVCEQGAVGACAAREERFAETFAKWATGDIGFNLYIGYKVPPPPSLDEWGRPLAALL